MPINLFDLRQLIGSLTVLFCLAGCASLQTENLVWCKYYMDGHDFTDIDSLSDAETCFSRAVQLAHAFPKNDPRLAWVLYDLGAIYFMEGKYQSARKTFDQAIEVDRETFGLDNLEEARCQNDLAKTWVELGKYAEAEKAAQKSAQIYLARMGEGDRFVGGALLTLGIVYYRQGRFAEAESAYRQALAADEKALGPHDLVVAKVLHNLADVLQDEHKLAEADVLYQREIKIKERLLGRESRELAVALNSLASLKVEQQDNVAAKEIYNRAASIFSERKDFKNMGHALVNLSSVYKSEGKLPLAYETCKRGVSATEEHLPAGHPELTHGYLEMADICSSSKKFTEAELYIGKIIAISSVRGVTSQGRSMAEARVQIAMQAGSGTRALMYMKELIDMEKALPMDSVKQRHIELYARLLRESGRTGEAQLIEKSLTP